MTAHVPIMDRWNLTGRTVLVTGASGGLGTHFARLLAEAGAKTVPVARRTAPLERMAEEIRSSASFSVAQLAAQSMKARGGTIVNVASILALRVAGQAAAKAGLVQLSKALALEWARYGIRVNAMCPGYIETPLNHAFFRTQAGRALIRRIPQRRLGTPQDLDGALLLLVSDAGAYITGTTLTVDGGHLVSSL